jgi:hypothetical protein
VLTQWTSHVEALAKALRAEGRDPVVLRGGMGVKVRAAALEQLEPSIGGPPLLVVATGPYVGEGFDCPVLDTLFLAAPIAFKGRLVQYAGRILRAHPGKSTAEVHDYHDIANASQLSHACDVSGALNGITAKYATLRNRVSPAQRGILTSREVSGGGLEPAVAWCHEQATCATGQVKVGEGLPVATRSHGLTRGDVPKWEQAFDLRAVASSPVRTESQAGPATRLHFTSL